MLDAARAAVSLTSSRTRDDLQADLMLQFAVVRALEIVGEAAARLSERTRTGHLEIPWTAFIGMINRLVHGYFDVDLEIVVSMRRASKKRSDGCHGRDRQLMLNDCRGRSANAERRQASCQGSCGQDTSILTTLRLLLRPPDRSLAPLSACRSRIVRVPLASAPRGTPRTGWGNRRSIGTRMRRLARDNHVA